MRSDWSKFSMVVLAGLAALSLACAQEPETPPAKDEKQPPVVVNNSKPVSDPTLLSPKLKKALQPADKHTENAAIKEVRIPKLPVIELKGLLLVTGEKAAAMIDVKGKGVMMVREGTQISVTEADGSSMTLIVKRISDQGVQLEAPSIKEVINLQ